MHAFVMRLHALAVAASVVVALMLAGGNGLPGLVRVLSQSNAHVCTCSTGGSHASCPVCNHALRTSRSPIPAFSGVPCGDRQIAAGAVGDPALPGLSFALLVGPAPALTVPAEVPASPPHRDVEPATPPPRSVLPG
jgi:hypothetical protein